MIQSGQHPASPHSHLQPNPNQPGNDHSADFLAATMKTRTTGMKLGLGALALGVWVAAQAAAPVITNITIVGGTPQFSIQSDLGITNQIQYSTNLGQTNWTVLTNIPVAASPYLFLDAAAPPNSQQFYRVAALYQANSPARTNMALIPAGSFTMGDSLDGDSSALPLHTVYISAFYMDKYGVTKALWDDVYNWATNNGYSFDYGDSGQGKAANHPAYAMTWFDALKWCNARSAKEGRVPAYYTSAAQTGVYRGGQTNVQNNWVKWSSGYRLPTEAEWEKAARGGVSGRRFPWGNTISWSQANYDSYWESGVPYYPYDVNPTSGYPPTFNDGVSTYTSPVDYFAPNGYGLYDMAGNVWQWCWDRYGAYSASAQTDPRGPASGSDRVIRGGSWFAYAFFCRSAERGNGNFPSWRFNNFGFRSVLPPGQ